MLPLLPSAVAGPLMLPLLPSAVNWSFPEVAAIMPLSRSDIALDPSGDSEL
jgi:hypothetical protein